MRNLAFASLATLAFAACGTSTAATSSTGTGTGGTTGGTGTAGTTTSPRTVTFTTVDVHPAAKAALANAGFPIPPITNGDYEMALDGVKVTLGASGVEIILTDAGVATLTSTTGPYVFALTDDFLQSYAALGVIGVVRPVTSGLGDGGLPQPTCPEFAQLRFAVGAYLDAGAGAVIPDFLLDAGFIDYLMPTGLEVGGQAIPPTTSVTGAVAYAVPMSYAVMLNCAGNPSKTTRDTDIGEALIYITNGAGPGQGTPVAGAVVPIFNEAGDLAATYYEDNYTMTDTTGTDATGVATYTGVSPASTTAPTIKVQGAAGLTFPQPYSISTQPDAFFSIVAYPH